MCSIRKLAGVFTVSILLFFLVNTRNGQPGTYILYTKSGTYISRASELREHLLHFWYGVDRELQYLVKKIHVRMVWVDDMEYGRILNSTKEWRKALLEYTRTHLGVSITISALSETMTKFDIFMFDEDENWNGKWRVG
ncbi:hypothetical protein EYC84_005740 [Monilinia fructicola]|uniref:Heterokaryon incompatibility domain-containing protein n=1 Tax=Monilinia fructicola TaxID=38448 RepID=A0A5M9JXJ0_MONFR|nr:hypothetical protein EYC84_005740 [Monilinia fructicola]